MLVAMVIMIIYNIRFFLIVLFFVLVGFMQAFWILSNINPQLYYGTVTDAFLNVFLNMFGQGISIDFSGTVSPKLTTFIMIMFMLTMMILMLNLLIALMGDAFGAARAKGKALWRREQCSIMIDQRFLLSDQTVNSVPPYIHVLKYTADVGKNENQSSSLEFFAGLVEQCSILATPYTPLEEHMKSIREADNNRKASNTITTVTTTTTATSTTTTTTVTTTK